MAQVSVKIPTPLRSFAGGAATIPVEGATVGEVLRRMTATHSGLGRHLFTPEGKLRSFVAVYRNDEDIRYLERDATPVKDGDVVSIVPAIAGGGEVDLRAANPLVVTERSVAARARTRSLSKDETLRYSRHLLLSEVGVEGQKKLRDAKVLIVGAGGLGSPTALYLAAVGVGKIGLVDFDRVEVSNLQRQILYTTADVGHAKVDVARDRLQAMNPGVQVIAHSEPLTSTNAMDVLRGYDIVIDGTDNFATRYLVNDACVLLGKPNVYGSIYRFEGQASVFDARSGPCYRCLYPEPPPPGLVPSCAEAGVLGVLPGIVGVIQATEAIKIILGAGEPLVGRLLLFDALAMSFRELALRKNPDCDLCGPHATQRGLIDYQEFCGVPAVGTPRAPSDVPEVSAEKLAEELNSAEPPFLLDVREPEEWEIAHLPGAHLIPRLELPDRLNEVTGARLVVVYCKSGERSSAATKLLLGLGFSGVRNLRGGIDAWAKQVDPSMLRY
ncbi:MAG: molybdopterin-synthase adenylyltransferase MoeB [Thermoplasmata archaeon]|nr:molybdopterin-synthase adenylyltransferase MoeB [Thermoplasmata archaeon]